MEIVWADTIYAGSSVWRTSCHQQCRSIVGVELSCKPIYALVLLAVCNRWACTNTTISREPQAAAVLTKTSDVMMMMVMMMAIVAARLAIAS